MLSIMDLTGTTLPGYRVCEYLLVLSPHEDLRNKIIDLRSKFNTAFNISQKPGKPNLLLVSFTNYEMMEERIINSLKAIALAYPPFKVDLKDFGSFPSHTIFININSKVGIQNLVKQIRTNAQKLMKFNDEHKPYFALEPHITIGSKLKPWQYEKAWMEYSNKHYSGRFIADGMVLVKRTKKEDSWQIVHRFEFQNMPVLTRQGDLFQ
jgi:2'-5' RNA ligase